LGSKNEGEGEQSTGIHPSSTGIHPTAIVHKGAAIGKDVYIGPFCIVGEHVKIGDRCRLRSHVSIEGHTEIGTGNEIFPFASIGAPPQDLKYRGEPTQLVIGSDNLIRECVTLQPGTVQGGGFTRIGSRNLFMAYTHVAHDCIVGDENILANGVQLSGHVTIENQTVLGGMSAVHQFCRIGDLGMLGGGSMIVQDVPPFAMVQGNHATFRGLNVVGMRRRGINRDGIASVKLAYKFLILDPAPTVDESVDRLLCALTEANDRPLVDRIVSFVKSSERGILRHSGESSAATKD
jgi:UDP-N-acetylglucosamine acyltransferase